MGALDELLAKWRENPDAGTTLALCAYLGMSRREELVREVGATAEAWHKEDAPVMLAVGRMYLDSGLLQEAQAALVTAGKLNQSASAAYRYLGEVLLRRGDAARAEKVLARALQIMGGGAAGEPDTRLWHDRAVVYVPLQSRAGMQVVADEVARTVPKKLSIPPPSLSSEEADRLAAVARPAPAPARAPLPPPPKLVSTLPPPPIPPSPAAFRPPVGSDADIPTGRVEVRDAAISVRDELDTIVAEPKLFASAPRPPAAAPVPQPAQPARPEASRAPAPDHARPRAPSRVGTGPFDDSARPSASTVLEHLARVGVYERGGGAAPAWAAPPREKPRGAWFLATVIALSAGLGIGAFRWVSHVRQGRMATARSIEADVEQLLETARVEDLRKTDGELSQVFDLDSRSERAAILWLRNRALSALMIPGEPRGIESALSRCRELGIDEVKLAFGKITSFLVEGDLAGAAAMLPKWDEKAKSDPYYHLAAGAMLERAGDVRAVGHYHQAFETDPHLAVARVFHAELVTVELGVDAARPVVEETVNQLGDGPLARALRGLLWSVDPDAGELPESSRVAQADRENLPAQLLSIPSLVDARLAVRGGHGAEALVALERALHAALTPAMATTIGQIAIELGDEALAREAALRALSYSAVYPRARSLAARVALLGGHLDEAKKAIQELDAKSPEVAVVRAAAAYESLDPSELESAVASMGPADGPARGLAAGAAIVMGKRYPSPSALTQMADPSVPWGDLIAVDASLDTGNLDLARKIANRWGERGRAPAYALRLSRLLRYEEKPEEAAKVSADAVVAGGVTPPVLVERFRALIASKDVPAARDLLGQYPAVLGPMTDFLKVSADAADGKAPRGKALAARLEPPPGDSPLLYGIVAASALVEVGDRRGKPLVEELLRATPRHPDLVPLARAVGLSR